MAKIILDIVDADGNAVIDPAKTYDRRALPFIRPILSLLLHVQSHEVFTRPAYQMPEQLCLDCQRPTKPLEDVVIKVMVADQFDTDISWERAIEWNTTYWVATRSRPTLRIAWNDEHCVRIKVDPELVAERINRLYLDKDPHQRQHDWQTVALRGLVDALMPVVNCAQFIARANGMTPREVFRLNQDGKFPLHPLDVAYGNGIDYPALPLSSMPQIASRWGKELKSQCLRMVTGRGLPKKDVEGVMEALKSVASAPENRLQAADGAPSP